MKALKVTISGSYKTADKDIIDYSDVSGIIPMCEEDCIQSYVMKRYAPIWIAQHPSYPKRLHLLRDCFINDIEEVDHTFTYVGKDIKAMSFYEMQDLAVSKALREIPLAMKGSLREAQIKAYTVYSDKILKRPLKQKPTGANFAKMPSITVDGDWVASEHTTISVEDSLQQEFAPPTPKMSFDDLKAIAKQKGIKFAPVIGYDTLYERVYG